MYQKEKILFRYDLSHFELTCIMIFQSKAIQDNFLRNLEFMSELIDHSKKLYLTLTNSDFHGLRFYT